ARLLNVLEDAVRELTVNPARLDHRELDAEKRLHVRREGLGVPLDRELRCAIKLVHWLTDDAAHGRDVDDVTALLRAHVRQGGLSTPRHAEEVHVKYGLRLVLRRLLGAAKEAGSSVVHQDVEAALLLDDVSEDRVDR